MSGTDSEEKSDDIYLTIAVATRASSTLPLESSIQDALSSTFEALGGITRAIVHFKFHSGPTRTSMASNTGSNEWEACLVMHKDDVKFVKAALPTYTPAPNATITGLRFVKESKAPPHKASSSS